MATYQHITLWRRLKRNRFAMASMVFLGVLVVLALLAPFIANHKPFYAVYKGETFYPAFTSKVKYTVVDPVTKQTEDIDIEEADWKQMKLESAVWPLIPYSPGRSDLMNADYVGPSEEQFFRTGDGKTEPMPGRFKHRLGTGVRGDDTLAGLIHGVRISLSVGIFSMLIASLLGILLGALAGYFGDSGLRTNRAGLWGMYVALIPAWFYAFYVRSAALSNALNSSILYFVVQLILSLLIFAGIVWFVMWLFKTLTKALPLRRGSTPSAAPGGGGGTFITTQVTVPIDTWVTRTIETIISIPGIILIIAIAAITQKLLGVIIVVIGLTSWTGIARLIRAEMLRIRELDYIVAAQAAGLKRVAIIFRHALPNAIQPALVSMVFGVASAILIESGLSFLGAFQVNDVTWGSLLAEGRNNFTAWWLVVFPGLAVFLTVTSLNLLGEALRDEMDVKEN
jgi:peptide/nickel transport system permease protein